MTVREFIENDMPVEGTTDYTVIIRDIAPSAEHIPSPLVFKNLKEVTTFRVINDFESILDCEIKTIVKDKNTPCIYINMPKYLTITVELFSKLINNYFTETSEKTIIDMMTFYDFYGDIYIKKGGNK